MDLQSDPIEVSDETESAIREYHTNGASVIRGILDQKWISIMREAIQRVLDHPESASVEYTPKGEEGRYYGDFFLWRRDPDFEEFMRHSHLPAIAAKVLKSNSIRFFYDQLLVKEPLTKEKTPFHQDLPYWPLKGEDILSIWVPFDMIMSDFNREEYVFSRDPIDGNSVMVPQPLGKTVVLQKFTQKWVGNHFRILKKMTTPIHG